MTFMLKSGSTPLSRLRQLVELNCSGNQIEDLDPLGSLSRLTEIDFSDSSLLVGFSKYLFDATDFGYAAFGFVLGQSTRRQAQGLA